MAFRGGRVRELQGRVRPRGEQAHGEMGLIQAFLTQVIADALSDNAEWRREAWAFLGDQQALAFWLSLGGVDTHAFGERLQQLRQHR